MFFKKSKAADQNGSIAAPKVPESEALPQNCEVLTTEWGSRVYLLGTNEFCTKCLHNVSKVIKQLRPSVVSLQCCSTRLDDIKQDEETAFKNLQISSAFLYMKMLFIALGGNGPVSALLFKEKVLKSKQTGLSSDADLRQAFTEVKKIPNCKLHLADIPEEILGVKSWGIPSVKERITYARRLYKRLQTDQNNPEDVHELESNKDYRQQEIDKEFSSLPVFKRLFISDRDRYLAYSLKKAAEPSATDKTPTVVGIVRMEHLDGIKDNWNKSDLDVDKIASLEKNYEVYEALKYGAVIMTFTYFMTRRIRVRKAWDLYFNVKR
ncbi:traB domain-containing protein-like [Saccostrea echinata]|uniref:traB domain-containing protein-like n=1 Tax=Saccostrea echinata TaxID=191078 RepID=UPI002A813BDF|nr:traB domain-containing protein-like [Saccostrea echinata]